MSKTREIVNPQVWNFEPMPAPIAGIFDEPATCVLKVNNDWVSFVIERLEILAEESSWTGTESEKRHGADSIKEFLTALASGGDCMYLRDVRIVDQILEKTFDGSTWIEVGAVGISDINISTGAAGTDASSSMDGSTLNITIPRGDVGAEFALDEPSLNDALADDPRRCAVAIGMVNWLFEKYNDTLDQIEAAGDLVASLDAVFGIFPVGYLIADATTDAINEALEATINLARTYDTVEHREAHQKWFYCNLQTDGALSQMVWESWLEFDDPTFNIGTPQGNAFAQYAFMFEFDAARARAAKESYGDDDGECISFGCDEWEFVFDFRTDQSLLGWSTLSPYATPTIVANGLQANVYLNTGASPDLSSRRVHMVHAIPYPDSTTRIQGIEMVYSNANVGNGNGGSTGTIATFRIWNSANAQVGEETSGNQGFSLPAGSKGLSIPGAVTILDTYKLFAAQVFTERSSNTDQPVTGSGTCEKWTVRGVGKNPFTP